MLNIHKENTAKLGSKALGENPNTEVTKPKSALAAVSAKVPKDFVNLNTNAFKLGLELGADFNW